MEVFINIIMQKKTDRLAKEFKGGKAIFNEPIPPYKCGGAPQKIVFLLDYYWKQQKIDTEVIFEKFSGVYFPVPKYAKALEDLHIEKKTNVNLNSNLIEVDGKNRTIVVENNQSKEKTIKNFDFLHLG